jgi:glycosyltransferase involved in cell wall biosynthesis
MEKTFLMIIPAYNAGLTIAELIEKISKFVNKSNIVVVDDGSLDQTSEIAQRAGVVVLKHESNKGKGEALRTGFRYALGKNYPTMITIDADLQHDPESIPDFIHKTGNVTMNYPLPFGERDRVRGNQDECNKFYHFYRASPDILIGKREKNLKIMPFPRWLSNNLTSVIVSVLSGQSIRDSQSGYRLISTQVLRNVKLESRNFDLEPEILIKASRKGFRIDEVPIRTIYRGGKSFINPLVDTGRFIKLMWRSLWW